VIVLAGPSGAGKSRLAERLGFPVLRLDDFYLDADADGLPRITDGAPSRRLVPRLLRTGNAGLVDWDDPKSWDHDAACEAIEALCRDGYTEVPVYDISRSARVGSQLVDLHGASRFVAEGIFAAEVVPECGRRSVLAGAYCITQHPWLTFVRRLRRDLAERRKPPLVLVRRGWALLRAQGEVVDHARRLGCEVLRPDEAYQRLT
jgi:uridine kinase